MVPQAHLRPGVHPPPPQTPLWSSHHLENRASFFHIHWQSLPRPPRPRPQRRHLLRSARPPTSKILNTSQKAISSSPYGPTWRLLRRNLTYEILHPSRVRAYSSARRWVLSLLIHRLRETAQLESSVRLIDHFQYAMFCLLVLMCFGDKLQENQIKEIETVQRRLLLGFRRFNVLNFWPRLGKILFRKRWKELLQLRQDQDKVFIPLVRSRLQAKRTRNINKDNVEQEDEAVAYVDTLVDLQLPEENRNLQEEEIVSLCSEFLTAGTDTTSTALQWIMANLVKHPTSRTIYTKKYSVSWDGPSGYL
ncbi:UNVERIFIED_CONTAM: cytochrome [Sesamum calycinum]|uniref:Cytochrome n=1 Tax=Sesamum calycinum TaxID=2727403 RepID=A0AAW2RRH3_9LAMI